MPKKVERCVEALKKKGVPEDDAWAICKAQHGSSAEEEEEEDE